MQREQIYRAMPAVATLKAALEKAGLRVEKAANVPGNVGVGPELALAMALDGLGAIHPLLEPVGEAPREFRWEEDGENAGEPKWILRFGDYLATVNKGFDPEAAWSYRVNNRGRMNYETAAAALAAAEVDLRARLAERIREAQLTAALYPIKPAREPWAYGWTYDSVGHAVVGAKVLTETREPTTFLKNVFAIGPTPLFTED